MPLPSQTFQAIAVSPGIAIGRVMRIMPHNRLLEPEPHPITEEEVASELERYHEAQQRTREQLTELQNRVRTRLDSHDADIFEAHLMLVDDRTLNAEVEKIIREEHFSVEYALYRASEHFASVFSGMQDEYLRAELVPHCPHCGKLLTMNLRCDDSFVEDAGWHAAAERYSEFLRRHEGQKILFLELGVGGNTPVIIDETADIKLAVSSIIHSKTFDNGMICASEQSVTVLDSVYDEVRAEFARRGCYFLKGDELDQVRHTILINGALNAKIVGQSAHTIAALAGVDVPEETKILIGEVESVELSEEFAHEKLSPVLAMYHAKDFDEALDKAEKLVCDGGHGHTASLYIHPAQKEKIMKHAERMEACRIVINTPSSFGGIGDLYNFKMAPSLTLGCGTWGGNSVSENVGVKHLLNVKTVAERRENMLWFRAPQKVYFKKGCMPVALDELGTVMCKKKCFIVTDTFLYKNGYVAPIEEKLDQLGIQHTCFYDVAPDPNLSSALKGAQAMRLFEPDCIIALGGGSAMDAGKIMWVMYEHPEVDFLDMAMRFMDIRKRVYTFPKMGEKAYFVAIPTSSGTGSEVTPFAVITDDRTGTKYPLADYELLPNMAIVDADNMMNQPRGLTSASGVDVLTHGLEAYASMMATDYTDGLALKSMKNVFDYLPRAYEYGAADPEARQKMADASCMAGMAFANAFLGVCHSMAHKLGAYHHLPHGVANALMICHVLRYNAAEVPAKMGTFPQYDHPHTLARYAECARFCGVCGKDDEETLDLFIDKIEELKAKVGIKKSIAEYGISEETFMSTLDQMVEDAFDDQCTGANPRYPLLKEIKAMYLKAYYGEKA